MRTDCLFKSFLWFFCFFLINGKALGEPQQGVIYNSPRVMHFQEKKTASFKGQWNLKLGAFHFAEGFDEANWTSFQWNAQGQYLLSSNLNLSADLFLIAKSAQIQSRFYEFSNQNLVFKNFSVNYHYKNFLHFSAGALAQDIAESPLLIEPQRSFPAIKETFLGSFWEVSFAQSLPTSQSVNMNLSEKEKSPRFLLEKFKAFGKEWSAGILHYVFFDLPSVIAEESARYGNTVSALTAPASRFSYEFNGAVLFMDHLKEWSPQWKSHIRFELLKNLVAPEKFNRGGRAVLGTTWTRSHLGLHPYIEIFFSESDVAPASYNSASLGHNNRQGVKYGLDLQFPKRGFGLNFAYVDSRLINRSLSQKDLSSFYFGLETLYVVF